VFDAAFKCEEKNLNNFSLTGPELVSSVFGVLCRFRRHEITFSEGKAETFHQVKITEDDCWSQRFLWRNMEHDMPAQVCRILLQTFWKNGIGWDDELKTGNHGHHLNYFHRGTRCCENSGGLSSIGRMSFGDVG
jgi:hypothetical protein